MAYPTRLQIQLALDQLDIDQAIEVASSTYDYIDIFEIGTPCLKCNGIEAIKRILTVAGDKPVLADLKTMDAGYYEAEPFYQAGASICTVLGAATTKTIEGVIAAARQYGGRVQVDLINTSNKSFLATQLVELGVDIIGIHTGIDSQQSGETPYEDLRAIQSLGLGCTLSVAGGIGAEHVRSAADLGAEIIVVGGKITAAPDPRAAAMAIQLALK